MKQHLFAQERRRPLQARNLRSMTNNNHMALHARAVDP
jgi:hypothetical protein